MITSFSQKIGILIKSSKIIKNWHLLPMSYFGMLKKDEFILEMKNGLKIKLRNTKSDLNQFVTVWLLDDYKKPEFIPEKTSIVIDVGAHIGLFALYASQFCTDGKIFCFEPIKSNFIILLDNIKTNNLNNVICSNKAISKSDDKLKMYLHKDESGHSIFNVGNEHVEVESTTLRNVFEQNKIEKCDLLKLDCEGSEYEIIDSLPDECFERIKKMLIEYHFADVKPNLCQKIIDKLRSFSFMVTVTEQKNGMGMLYVKK